MKSARHSPWSDEESLLLQLQKLWDKGALLQSDINACELFPLRLHFKSPSSKELSERFDAVRGWIAAMQNLQGLRLVYKTVRHHVIGENTLPVEAWVDNIDIAIALIDKQHDAADFAHIAELTRQRLPQLLSWIDQHPLKALSLAADWTKLLDFLCWRRQHANPDIYLRQVNLPGIDSKWIEHHRSILSQLLDEILPSDQIQMDVSGVKHFETRYGFRGKPERIRFRLLDPSLALFFGDDHDISLTALDFKNLDRHTDFIGRLERVFITENEINFLAFPPQPASLVIFGSGYGFAALAQATWLASVAILYWGDIDTHGFAILDQLRSKFPRVRSLLMDERTLMTHREFWGTEHNPESRALSRLTPEEQDLYQALIHHQYQPHLRLEQERIRFDAVLEYTRKL